MEETTVMKIPGNEITKLDKFDGSFFKRWKGKMHFFLTALKIAHVLNEEKPTAPTNTTGETPVQKQQREKWKQDDFMCKGYILNWLSNTLYDVYEPKFANSTSRELWEDLDKKYKIEDAGNKKFPISKLFDYRMVGDKSIISQTYELQDLMNQIISEGHSLDESFQVSTIISKLPFVWKDCRKELKQKKDAMTMQELIKYIQVGENSRKLDKLELEEKSPKVHVIENASSKDKKRKFDGKGTVSDKKKGNFTTRKAACWKWEKAGHFKNKCRVYLKEKQQKDQANVVDNDDWTAMIFEVYAVGDDEEWWIDSGATKHIAKNKNLFKVYDPIAEDKISL
ncbi:uncharacterized protein LOC122672378 [Telopea speciosissima]|uniref:uncharacterized protein LOC122672378 n=1 Tax=Telopea speciosissima TaxID=54955 RepID=UPI001CC61ADB|nr:uncharacterized protein LOC122672378 [Telopea speciosissima]